jgi:rhodanese-related sulfurtransferase
MKTVFIIAGILLTIYIAYRSYRITTLDKGLDAKISKGAVILDVRTVREFDQGHIKGSINIPLSHLHAGSIPLDTQAVIVTCCSHGLRSVKAVSVLKERGYKHVYNGGAWSDLNDLIKRKR